MSDNTFLADDVQIRIYPSPEGIGYAQNTEMLALQGEDPHSGHPEGLVLSSDWSVSVGGHEVPVYAVPVTRGGPHSFAGFDYVGDFRPVSIIARSAHEIESATIRPRSLGINCHIVDNEVRFTVDKPCHLVIETNDGIQRPLTISVNPPEKYVPDRRDPNVLWFGPGIHQIDPIELTDNQTIYIEGGAILQANQPSPEEAPVVETDWAGKAIYRDLLSSHKTTGIRIHGRGIIDTSGLDWHARKPIFLGHCSDVKLEGITITGASHWTVHMLNCTNAEVDNLKLYGYRENSDGIDIVSSRNVTVRNCFVRTGDDAVCVKAMIKPPAHGGKDILVEKCVVWNDKVRCFGIASENISDIEDVVFRDCDIIRSYADWTEELGSLCVIICDSGTVTNVLFEDMRIEHEVKYALNCTIMKDRWSSTTQPGQIRDIVFRNIQIPKGVPSRFHGYDKEHMVENIRVERLQVGDTIIRDLQQADFRVNQYVSSIKLSY